MGRFSSAERRALLEVARRSIAHGVERGRPCPIDLPSFAEALHEPLATFVTLTQTSELRGCIGSLEPRRPLVEDVAHNAFNAAFRDPRFPPVNAGECATLELHISILQPPEPMTFRDEADLLAQIRPGIDGLVLEDGFRRGTFLPSVWEQLPEARAFWRHLKRKAGLSEAHWSRTLRVSRYTTEEFGAEQV